MNEQQTKTVAESLIGVADKSIAEIAALIKLGETPEKFLENVYGRLNTGNHLLLKSVRYTHSDIVESLRQEFPGIPYEIHEAAGIWAAAGLAAALNIVLNVHKPE